MTETKALILVFIGIGVVAIASAAVMSVIEVSGVTFGLVNTILVALGALAASEVVRRYGAQRERRKREEILLR